MNFLRQKLQTIQSDLCLFAFDINVILTTRKIRYLLHTMNNHCAKYEHPQSKIERGVRVTSYKKD